MPDPIEMLKATGLAMVISALMLGIIGWWGHRRTDGRPWIDAGWTLGIGAGYYLGCWMLEIRPDWRLREDQDRLLGLVIPAALSIELLAAFPKVPRWSIWASRAALAGLGGRILLNGPLYVGEASAWSSTRLWLILGAIAAAEAAAWVLLVRLSHRGAGASLPIALALTIGGASVTIMLSFYVTGGQAGLPLSAAVLGASLAAMVLPGASRSAAPIGLSVVGLSSLLIIGRFFGDLRTDHAVLLFAAPLLAWLPELPRLRRLPPWGRGLLRVVLVGLVVSGVFVDAARRYMGNTGPTAAPGSKEPTAEDYLNFGN